MLALSCDWSARSEQHANAMRIGRRDEAATNVRNEAEIEVWNEMTHTKAIKSK